MTSPWQKLKSKVVYKNKWMRVIEDQVIRPDGNKGIYAFIKKDPFVSVIAMSSKKEIYLVNLYRYDIRKYSWELIEGGIDKDESPLAAARRELVEEAGITAKTWKYLGKFIVGPGTFNQICYIFLAQNLIVDKPKDKENEIKSIKKLSLNQLDKLIKDDKIFDAPTIVSLYKLKQYLKLW